MCQHGGAICVTDTGMSRPGVFLVKRVDQIEAFGSPAKKEILLYTSAAGPCSVPEMAEALGRTVTSLYRHVHQLVELGLLLEAGTARTIRRDKTIYTTPARHMRLHYDPASPKTVNAMCKAINSHCRAVGRGMTRAFQSGLGRTSGGGRNVYFSSEKGWVTPERLAEINEHIEAINGLLQAEREGDATELASVTVSMWSNESIGGADD